jgi:hypothetical protein
LKAELGQVHQFIQESEQAKKEEAAGKDTSSAFMSAPNGLEDDALPKKKSDADK